MPSYLGIRTRIRGTYEWNLVQGNSISPKSFSLLSLSSTPPLTEYEIQIYHQGTDTKSNIAIFCQSGSFYLVIPIRISTDTWRFVIRFYPHQWSNSNNINWIVNGYPTISIPNNGYSVRDLSGLQVDDSVPMYLTDGTNPSQIINIKVE